jgi:hypothetical protein
MKILPDKTPLVGGVYVNSPFNARTQANREARAAGALAPRTQADGDGSGVKATFRAARDKVTSTRLGAMLLPHIGRKLPELGAQPPAQPQAPTGPTGDNRASRAVLGASQRTARTSEQFDAIWLAGASAAARGPRSEVDTRRIEFNEWSSSLPRRGNLLVARQKIASVLRGVENPQPAPLAYVSDLASHSALVIYEQYTPSAQELDSGNVLLDAQHQGGSRWMFYKVAPFKPPEPGHVPAGALVIPTDDPLAPQQVEENFQPTQEQLASGKYYLDSDNGTHRWYRLEDPKWPSGESE